MCADSEISEQEKDVCEVSGGALSTTSSQDEVVVEPVDVSGAGEDPPEDGASSSDEAEVLSLTAVREVGEGGGLSTTSPLEAGAIREGDSSTGRDELQRCVRHNSS